MTDMQLEYLRGFRDGARREVHDELKPVIEQILTGIAETYNGVLNTLISNITIEGIPDEKWVPCIERLPENRDDVLVWFEYFRYGEYNRMYQTYGIGNFYGKHGKREEWLINHETGWQNLRVLAWMPMPKPYEPKKESEVPRDD